MTTNSPGLLCTHSRLCCSNISSSVCSAFDSLTGRGPPTIRRGNRSMEFEISNSAVRRDRKSTRLNSSHLGISYAVFCLKKKKKKKEERIQHEQVNIWSKVRQSDRTTVKAS